jgi:hypothetical protein
VRIDADAVCVISREYFTDPRAARPSRFRIDALASSPPPAPLDDERLARRLRAVATFVRETLRVVPLPELPPNVVGPPMPWSPYVPGWGTPDNIYALGAFRLGPDEALVIEGRSPPCTYWGVQLWNRFMQSLDHRYHRVSVNHEQATLLPDGSFRIVVAHRDPGSRTGSTPRATAMVSSSAGGSRRRPRRSSPAPPSCPWTTCAGNSRMVDGADRSCGTAVDRKTGPPA